MTHEQKKQVRDALLRYVNNFPTQAAAAQTLDRVSASTISLIKNHNWDLLSDRLWQHISRQVGFYCGDWQPADTSVYMLMRILLGDAQRYGMAYGITMPVGSGKTFSATHYAHAYDNVLYIAGREHYNRKSFLTALLRIAGCEEPAGTTPGMLRQLAQEITEKDQPLVLIDDAHLLRDRVLHLVVLLLNSLHSSAGIILLGDAQLRMRIIDGVRLKKPGFEEIFQSIGRRFVTMSSMAPSDIPMLCRANGVHDEDVIAYISGESGNNLHTATLLINQYVPQQQAA